MIVDIDCRAVACISDFWALYLLEVEPEGESFGKNVDALWDALSAGGPGYPSKAKVLRLVNTDALKTLQDGEFYRKLVRIEQDLNDCGYTDISLEVE